MAHLGDGLGGHVDMGRWAGEYMTRKCSSSLGSFFREVGLLTMVRQRRPAGDRAKRK